MQLYFWRVTEDEFGLGAETWTSTVEEFQEEYNSGDYERDFNWFFLTEEEREANIRDFIHKLEPIMEASYDYDKEKWYSTRRDLTSPPADIDAY